MVTIFSPTLIGAATPAGLKIMSETRAQVWPFTGTSVSSVWSRMASVAIPAKPADSTFFTGPKAM